ncbi:MAG: type II toxin-antitoxin system RelE/ParE family toxin [Bacteroidota bacterium]|jgi:phage-related protein
MRKDEQHCRTVIIYKNYFPDFFKKQTPKARDKILWVLKLIEEVEVIPETYLKHLTGAQGLYEVRVQQGNNIFRIFCFFDDGRLIVLMNGFQKKTQKTPSKELSKALIIKKEYDEEKENNNT